MCLYFVQPKLFLLRLSVSFGGSIFVGDKRAVFCYLLHLFCVFCLQESHLPLGVWDRLCHLIVALPVFSAKLFAALRVKIKKIMIIGK